jgi:tetratricopeptide (TPR) repeat protein
MDSNELAAIRGAADADAEDVRAQIQAAYACDGEGFETEAAVYYDRAWRIGVSQEERHDFLVGYGSTLRNVGRLDESITVLETAAGEFPGDLAPPAFLALALNSAGRHDEAIALLIESLVACNGPGVERFSRALVDYADLLRG